MQIFKKGLSEQLSNKILLWALSYYHGKSDISQKGYPNPVVTFTNAAWLNSPQKIIKDSKPVIIYFLEDSYKQEVLEELKKIDVLTGDESEVNMLVNCWTPGSYIPLHTDGDKNFRKAITIYLNTNWDLSNGGTFHYLESGEVKTVVPEQGLVIFNDNDLAHYTTPVHEGHLRVSLQIWAMA